MFRRNYDLEVIYIGVYHGIGAEFGRLDLAFHREAMVLSNWIRAF